MMGQTAFSGEREDLSHPLPQPDFTPPSFRQAHTVLAGLVLVCGLVYITFFDSQTGADTAQNIRR